MIPLLLIRIGNPVAGVGKATATDTHTHSASTSETSRDSATASDAPVGGATIADDP